METPSSTRRVTRSQTALHNSIPVSKGKNEEFEKTRTRNKKLQQQQEEERSALIDITNDSPIVGLAMETPSSAITKQKKAKNIIMMTPGSGEALLRGQVKTLLQKVEEEAQLSKVSLETRPFRACHNSPMGILAPTPANTPQISTQDGEFENCDLGSIVLALPVVEEQMRISEVVSEIFNGKKQEESTESQKSLITRSLLLDFSEKSESLDSSECDSVVTDQGMISTGESSSTSCKEKSSSLDDDTESIWSIQVNASSHDEDEEEIIEEMGDNDNDDDDYYEEEEEEEDDCYGGLINEFCEGLRKINMEEMFTGKHTRFVYNSDDEIDKEEEYGAVDSVDSDTIRLKGLPTPKGKHLRFPVEEQDLTVFL